MYIISLCHGCNKLTLSNTAQIYKCGYDFVTTILCYKCCRMNKEGFGPYALSAIENDNIYRVLHTKDSPFNFVFR